MLFLGGVVAVLLSRERGGNLQDEILRDGLVTQSEYDMAFKAFTECAPDGSIIDVHRDPISGVWSYQILDANMLTVDKCYFSIFGRVDFAYQVAQQNRRND